MIAALLIVLCALLAFTIVASVDLHSARLQAKNALVLADAAALELTRAQARNMRLRAFIAFDEELRTGCECSRCNCARALIEEVENGK